MRNSKHEFEVSKHEDFGTLGLCSVNMPNADPLGGMAVAHDILEHFPGDDGSVADEFQALGAAVYVRAQPGYFHMRAFGNADASENLAADFPELLLQHCIHQSFELEKAPRTTRLEDGDAEETIQESVRKGIVNTLEEMQDAPPADLAFVRQSRKDLVSWMRIGYRRAARRFRSVPQHELTDLFSRIEERADKFLKNAEEGMHLVVTVNFDKREVYFEEKYPGLDEE